MQHHWAQAHIICTKCNIICDNVATSLGVSPHHLRRKVQHHLCRRHNIIGRKPTSFAPKVQHHLCRRHNISPLRHGSRRATSPCGRGFLLSIILIKPQRHFSRNAFVSTIIHYSLFIIHYSFHFIMISVISVGLLTRGMPCFSMQRPALTMSVVSPTLYSPRQ